MRNFSAEPYISGFDGLTDIQREFSGYNSEPAIQPEDLKNVLFAVYATPSYEGYAEIYFMRPGECGHTLWSVVGSHCSCYGLVGQWDPVETCVDAVLKRKPIGLSDWSNEEKAMFQEFKEWLEHSRPLFEGEEDAE
jgi:hypothetical protein